MKWKKVSPELNRFLDDRLASFPAERRPMFGASTYFANGNMFAGIHEDMIILRLSEKDREEIMSLHDEVAPFQPMEGRIMKEYVTLPETVYGQPEELGKWLGRSHKYALSLKPKEKAVKKKR